MDIESNDFGHQLTALMSRLDPKQQQLLSQAFRQVSNNDRQKLKIIKRVIEGSENSPLKALMTQSMGPLIVSEYIYGNLESKPYEINILKNINIEPSTLLSFTDRLGKFDYTKRMVEILQAMASVNKITAEYKMKISELIIKIFSQLAMEMGKGTELIANNNFRTKWLDIFVEVLRSVNYVIRFIGAQNLNAYEQNIRLVVDYSQKCLKNCYVLTKQVLTQIYLILVFIDEDLPLPADPLLKIHYYHACTIVKNQNTLEDLLKLTLDLKQTEHKCQITTVLLKSFQENYRQQKLTPDLKNNAFDIIIVLFDIGRSLYSYLEEMVFIIISHGGSWNLEGNYARRFFISRVALKLVETKVILDLWPTVIEDCINCSGNMTYPYVADCMEIYLTKLYEEDCDKNYGKWISIWIGPYKKALLSENRASLRGVIDFVNPILLKIDSTNPELLKQLMEQPDQGMSDQLGIISLLKCYKEIGKIVPSATIKSKEQDCKQQEYFVHVDDPTFKFSHKYLLNLLLSNDSMIATNALEFLTTSRKPSLLISGQEMKLMLEFYKNCLKTSMPDYRKNYLNLTRKLLERLRRIYEKDIMGKSNPKDHTLYYSDFLQFMQALIELCFGNIYPDSIFEITNPALEILLLILVMFGPQESEIRKNAVLKPSAFLIEKTSFFKMEHFFDLVSCLQSSYESIREISHQIINRFKFAQIGETAGIQKIWNQCILNTNKLSIKSYEFASRLLTFISNLDEETAGIIENLPQKYSLHRLNVCEYFLELLRSRYDVFKNQFVEEGQVYYRNLLHGILTCFAYILEEVKDFSNLKEQQFKEMRQFLSEFFKEIVNILNFAVDISSSNVSTVVLDTLANTPQTEKRLKVDCRGHFLQEKKNSVSEYLSSPALISSMENQQQGIQNTLVVSFYLLTREAGLVFQTIGNLVGNPDSNKFIPKQELIELINTYFYALINLKHMGSVDRISIGLSKMSKVIFDQEDKDLNQIPEQLLNKLLELLTDGKFTNILRRSAGVPYAFSCLLKSEALKRKQLIQKTIRSLFSLAKQSSGVSIELQIHSLNILKKLFQDSDIKQDLDIYVSEAFIISIRGFTSEQWGIRNSSLMLFSTLANRTLGIKPTFNLLEFFHKCPELYEFVSSQLQAKRIDTMYPPLYPIVLLLSRLLPFDLKQKARMTIKGSTIKQVRKEELLLMLPLLQSAGNNSNYMGRVMTAKAILPFMDLSNIIPHCLDLLMDFNEQRRANTINNNAEHYRLMECYQLLVSYNEILISHSYAGLQQISEPIRDQMYSILLKNAQLLHLSPEVSPTVHEIYLKIYYQLLSQHFRMKNTSKDDKDKIIILYEAVAASCQTPFESFVNHGCVVVGDLGNSLMNKSFIHLLNLCYGQMLSEPGSNCQCKSFYIYLVKLQQIKMERVDNEMLCLVLEKVCGLVSKKDMKVQKNWPLYEELVKWVRAINIEDISNDDILISVLEILQATEEWRDIVSELQKIQSRTQNKKLKVSIFDYLLKCSSSLKKEMQIEKQLLRTLVQSYSSPDQLSDLRQCCIRYLEQSEQLEPQLIVVYIRLLEDEEYEIRKQAASRLSQILNIPPSNEYVVYQKVLSQILTEMELPMNFHRQFLSNLLRSNSDYLIRTKNHEEERIFSYDKPNKYRTDINTLVDVLEFLPIEAINQVMSKQTQGPHIDAVVKDYAENITERDEYQFETIIRCMMRDLPGSACQAHQQASQFHSLLLRVNEKMLSKKLSTKS